ncbi:hypothetical protein EV127DRAFT_410986 [Xylaria flabelliformis]|nr:hypothetical protein EV127DRAFT_410986 [Xylaria flabelliformis]
MAYTRLALSTVRWHQEAMNAQSILRIQPGGDACHDPPLKCSLLSPQKQKPVMPRIRVVYHKALERSVCNVLNLTTPPKAANHLMNEPTSTALCRTRRIEWCMRGCETVIGAPVGFRCYLWRWCVLISDTWANAAPLQSKQCMYVCPGMEDFMVTKVVTDIDGRYESVGRHRITLSSVKANQEMNQEMGADAQSYLGKKA